MSRRPQPFSTRRGRVGTVWLAGAATLIGLSAPAAPAAPVSASLPIPGSGPGITRTWSGYMATGGTYNGVTASWVQPAAKCPSPTNTKLIKNTNAVFWVGLDGGGGVFGGRTSKTLVQIGSGAHCKDGKPHYYGWSEIIPAAMSRIPDTVRAGDHLTASVHARGTTFTMSLVDWTRRWAYNGGTHNVADATKHTAEVIAEAPLRCVSGHCSPWALTNFGKVSFYNAKFNGKGLRNFNTARVVMMHGATLLAKPSALSANGKRFSVTWHHQR